MNRDKPSTVEAIWTDACSDIDEAIATKFNSDVDYYIKTTDQLTTKRSSKVLEDIEPYIDTHTVVAIAHMNPMTGAGGDINLAIDVVKQLGYPIQLTSSPEDRNILLAVSKKEHSNLLIDMIYKPICSLPQTVMMQEIQQLMKRSLGLRTSSLRFSSFTSIDQQVFTASQLANSVNLAARIKNHPGITEQEREDEILLQQRRYIEVARDHTDIRPHGPEEVAGMIASLIHAFLEENHDHRLENIQ